MSGGPGPPSVRCFQSIHAHHPHTSHARAQHHQARTGSRKTGHTQRSHSSAPSAHRAPLNAPPPPAEGNGTATRSQLAGLRRRYLQAMRARIPPERRGARWLVDKALSNAWLVGHIALMMPRVRRWGEARTEGGCMVDRSGSRGWMQNGKAHRMAPCQLAAPASPSAVPAGLPGACGASPRRCRPVIVSAVFLPGQGALELQPDQ